MNIKNNTGSAEFAQGSYDCWITNSEITGAVNDYGFAFYGGVYNSGITDSLIGGNGGDGVTVLNDGGQTVASHDIIIAKNVIWGNAAAGVGVRSNGGATDTHKRIAISGNTIYGNNQQNNPGIGGIYLYNVYAVTVNGNTIHDDGNGGVSSAGIDITTSAYNVNVTGNLIYNEGQGGGLGVGITLNGPFASIIGNTIWDDQSTKTMAYAINGTVGVSTSIIGNTFYGTIGTRMNSNLKTDTIAINNTGYNPVGSKSPPVPDSTSAFSNPYGAPATVYITGGTMTDVSVAGTQVGTGAGTYRVGAKQSITLTYSAAPTWVWIVE